MEIETKIKVDNLNDAKKKLVSLGATFSHTTRQIDDYYKEKGKEKETQRPGSFLLRIRKQKEKSQLAFKALTNKTGVWIEHETDISKPEEVEKILEFLNYVKIPLLLLF